MTGLSIIQVENLNFNVNYFKMARCCLLFKKVPNVLEYLGDDDNAL